MKKRETGYWRGGQVSASPEGKMVFDSVSIEKKDETADHSNIKMERKEKQEGKRRRPMGAVGKEMRWPGEMATSLR